MGLFSRQFYISYKKINSIKSLIVNYIFFGIIELSYPKQPICFFVIVGDDTSF